MYTYQAQKCMHTNTRAGAGCPVNAQTYTVHMHALVRVNVTEDQLAFIARDGDRRASL